MTTMSKHKVYDAVQIMNSIEATLHQKPKFNPYQNGYGEWKSLRHPNRNRQKRDLKKRIDEEIE